MVKTLSADDKKALADAITEAERQTSLELVVVMAPASDPYQSYLLIYGLILGSLIGMVLWSLNLVTGFPFLFAIQLSVVMILSFIPQLRSLWIKLVPKNIQQYRTKQRAYEEYFTISHQVSATIPIVLLYISIAEHYVHIIPSRLVREKISEEHWNNLVNELTTTIGAQGIKMACIQTIQHITDILKPHFPEKGEQNSLSETIVEVN
ncbi:MAG: hypothetical protein K1X44_05345 [Alphaproteobacteria bacterium]|nr:hypothetical protein [Alphaproteobacteria bacterium]